MDVYLALLLTVLVTLAMVAIAFIYTVMRLLSELIVICVKELIKDTPMKRKKTKDSNESLFFYILARRKGV